MGGAHLPPLSRHDAPSTLGAALASAAARSPARGERRPPPTPSARVRAPNANLHPCAPTRASASLRAARDTQCLPKASPAAQSAYSSSDAAATRAAAAASASKDSRSRYRKKDGGLVRRFAARLARAWPRSDQAAAPPLAGPRGVHETSALAANVLRRRGGALQRARVAAPAPACTPRKSGAR